MRTHNLLAASVLRTALVFGGLAAIVPVALASTVEGKISSVSAATDTFMIGKNKKSYRISDTAKVLISGKPGNFTDVKNGMNCKAHIANAVEALQLICTK